MNKCCARCKTPYNCAAKACRCHLEAQRKATVPQPIPAATTEEEVW